MNLDKVLEDIESTDWLSSAGRLADVLESDSKWDWLPTSRDQDDPFDGPARSKDSKDFEQAVYKATLKSLRKMGRSIPMLKNGPHDYTEAFRSAVLFAFKMAAREIALNNSGKWVEVSNLYMQGKWPCGLDTNGVLVVL
jgi:hypothetical protein